MKRGLFLLLILTSLFIFPLNAYADIAPPDQPDGANLIPGNENTQVRMLSETVVIDVQGITPVGSLGQARVSADFTMRNIGGIAESMVVRFPLTFWNGNSDGFNNFPEISGVQIYVNDLPVPTTRVTTPNPIQEGNPIPWAAFEVNFPSNEDVQIEVTYTAEAMGEYPFIAFGYVLETGGGWKGTIGNAEVIVRLPYEATHHNVLQEAHTGYSTTSPGAVLIGNEIRWYFENLEPTSEHNLEITIVMPEIWNKVLFDLVNINSNPEDGEAWGRLGKVYKEISRFRRSVRSDPSGQELYRLSLEAYERAVSLLPEDGLWHAGFADLLWFHYYWEVFMPGNTDISELDRAIQELKRAYELAPLNETVQWLLDDIRFSMPEAVSKEGDTYLFLLLTATPVFPPTDVPTTTPLPPPSDTPEAIASTLTPSPAVQPTQTSVPKSSPTTTIPPTNVVEQSNPQDTTGSGVSLCGAAVLIPLVTLVALRKRKVIVENQ
jgi:tetratricopeptide (TPR) repeat protein